MGPYYLTALVSLMGPITRIAGSAQKAFSERTVTSEPKNGYVITVETPTHIAGTADFANGAVATLITSFDVWSSTLPPIEIHGTHGSLLVPDPNGFGGPVRVNRGGSGWEDVPLLHGYAENSRGLGVADMRMPSGKPPGAGRRRPDVSRPGKLCGAFLDSSSSPCTIECKARWSAPPPCRKFGRLRSASHGRMSVGLKPPAVGRSAKSPPAWRKTFGHG